MYVFGEKDAKLVYKLQSPPTEFQFPTKYLISMYAAHRFSPSSIKW